MRVAALLFVPLLWLTACGDDELELPVELGPSQVVVAVSTIDGQATATLVAYRPGEPVRVKSDPDKPIYTWVLDTDDYVHPDGSPVDTADLTKVSVRTDNAIGISCGRCLVPTSVAPQIVNAGDSCLVPTWNPGAVWRKDGDEYRCFGSSGSRVCPGESADDAEIIERVRRIVFVDWPGECACRAPAAVVNNAKLDITAIEPAVSPWPMSAVSARSDGVVAGFSRHGAMVWRPDTKTTEFTPFDGIDTTMTRSVALDDGDFFVAAEAFNTGITEEYRYYRVPIVDGRAQTPIAVDTAEQAIAEKMIIFDNAGEFPLYIVGGQRVLGSVEPGMYACSAEGNIVCQRVALARCTDERGFSRAQDMVILPDGSGVVMAHQGLYYKAPNEPPLVNPHPSDNWMCEQLDEPIPDQQGLGSTDISELNSMTSVGDRVFVCGIAESTARCESRRPVVITATVSAAFGEMPKPDWRTAWIGNPGVRCRDFMPVPASGIVRLQLSGYGLLDFDMNGTPLETRSLRDEYGSFDGMGDIRPLANGYLLGSGPENQLYVNTATNSFEKIYGTDTVSWASYRAIGVEPSGSFIVFGHPRGPVRVEVRTLDDYTTTVLQTDALSGVRVEAAVEDKSVSTEARPVFLIGGAKDSDAYLARVEINGDQIAVSERLSVPQSFDDLEIIDIAETTPGRFVAITQGSRALAIEGTSVTEVVMDYDDPSTEEVEALPRAQPDSCSGNTPRIDALQRVVGGQGVAWASGRYGIIVRIANGHAERFAIEHRPEFPAITMTCPDQVTVAGRGSAADLNDINPANVFYELGAVELDPEEEDLELNARPLDFMRFGEQELLTLGIGDIVFGRPIDVLLDSNSDGSRAYSVLMSNGFIYRLQGTEPIRYTRPPFSPRRVVQSPNGTMLFSGADGHLAIGVP